MTGQVSEAISYEGIDLPLLCEPPLPKNEPRLLRVSDIEARQSNELRFSTACWRNYIGEWAIRGAKLYLVGIRGIYCLSEGPPLFASWFSGVLRMAAGGLVNYVHGGHMSRYAREFYVEVELGNVVRTWNERHHDEPEPPDESEAWPVS